MPNAKKSKNQIDIVSIFFSHIAHIADIAHFGSAAVLFNVFVNLRESRSSLLSKMR